MIINDGITEVINLFRKLYGLKLYKYLYSNNRTNNNLNYTLIGFYGFKTLSSQKIDGFNIIKDNYTETECNKFINELLGQYIVRDNPQNNIHEINDEIEQNDNTSMLSNNINNKKC